MVWSRLDDVGPDQIAPRVSLHAKAFRHDVIEELRASHLNRFARPPQRVELGAQQKGVPSALKRYGWIQFCPQRGQT
jgi:hypothetical protein